MKKDINFSITPVFTAIDHIKESIQTQLGNLLSQELIDATMVCAVELAENAVKYGVSVPNMHNIQFRMLCSENEVKIRVSNGVNRQEDIDKVRSIIDSIKGGSAERLYHERLSELMRMVGNSKSQLGLLRIANETGFTMTYEINGLAITVEASRRISKG